MHRYECDHVVCVCKSHISVDFQLASEQLKGITHRRPKIPYKSFYFAMCSNFALEIDQKAINFCVACMCVILAGRCWFFFCLFVVIDVLSI